MIAKLLFTLLLGSVVGVTVWLARTPAEPRGFDTRRLRHNWIERETRDLGRMLARYAKESRPRAINPVQRPDDVHPGDHTFYDERAA